jgi:hypothetical protein
VAVPFATRSHGSFLAVLRASTSGEPHADSDDPRGSNAVVSNALTTNALENRAGHGNEAQGGRASAGRSLGCVARDLVVLSFVA